MDNRMSSSKNRASWRKPVGIVAILAIIAIWSIIVASNAASIGALPVLLQGIIYLIAGIIWIFPVKPILQWMETGTFRA
jgi:hypothetical protein